MVTTPTVKSSTNNTSTSTDNTTTSEPPLIQQRMPPLPLPPNLKFGPFTITPQVFHLSPTHLSYGLVNLKPLLPGHILICPVRPVPRLSHLTPAETSDLFLTVQRVSKTLERVYKADALNVAVQDGVEAGQSVPHVHVHVIPRVKRDMEGRGGGDKLYDLMDGEEGDLGGAFLRVWRRRREMLEEGRGEAFGGPDGEDGRVERSEEVMRVEAEWLRGEMEKDADGT